MKRIALNHGCTLIDDDDVALVTGYTWWLHSQGYAITEIGGRQNKRRIFMHRLISGAGIGEVVDHINRDKLDNRRVNLRIGTQALNNQNLSPRGGSSPHRGVCICKRTQRWQAYARTAGHMTHLGRYDTEEEAAAAVAAFRAKHMPFSADARRVCDESETQEVAA